MNLKIFAAWFKQIFIADTTMYRLFFAHENMKNLPTKIAEQFQYCPKQPDLPRHFIWIAAWSTLYVYFWPQQQFALHRWIIKFFMKPQKCMNSNAECSVSSSTALSLCASQTNFSAKCEGDKMFNQAKKNNSSDNFVLSSFPSKYANRFWRGFYTKGQLISKTNFKVFI